MNKIKLNLKYLRFTLNWIGQFEQAYINHINFTNSPIPLPRTQYLTALTEGVSLVSKMWNEVNQQKLRFSDE